MRSGEKKFDVFISYRRVGGDSTARILCERLRDAGYKVFYDVETLRSGDFNQKLYDVIAECEDFLIILSPGALDRCDQQGDWVRNELSFALKQGKNVIPIMLRDFVFPEYLPEDINAVRHRNGLEASTEFFDAFVDKLKAFLKSRTNVYRRVIQNAVVRRAFPVFIALVALSLCVWGGYAVYDHVKNRAFPYTLEEKNVVSELLGNMSRALASYNSIVLYERNALQASADCLLTGDTVVTQNALSTIDQAIFMIGQIDPAKTDLSATLSDKLDKTRLDKGDVQQFMDNYELFHQEATDNLRFIKYIVRDAVFSVDIKKQIADLYLQANTINGNNAVYLTNAVVLPVQESSLHDFKQALAYCTALPFERYTWTSDGKTLQTQIDSSLNKLQDVYAQFSSLVGQQNVQYANEVEAFRTTLGDMGYSNDEIDDKVRQIVSLSADTVALQQRIQKKEDEVVTKKREVQAAQETYETNKAKLRAKFAPVETDSMGILWGKMLRFLNVNMPDEALTCLEMYKKSVIESDPYAETYVAAAKAFISAIGETGIDYGAIVTGFEGNMVNHPTYQIGDIIVAINGERCLNAEVFYNNARKEGDKLTLLRFPKGKPKLEVVEYHAAAYRVAYNNMSEREDAEDTQPFFGLDMDALWARMCSEAGSMEFQAATDCLQIYHMKARQADSNADVYVPALKQFYDNIKWTGINYGAVVTALGPDVESFRPGDVIVAVNWNPCEDTKEFESLIIGSNSVVTVLRADGSGLKTVDILMDVRPAITVRDVATAQK